jgi:hypothetical protein
MAYAIQKSADKIGGLRKLQNLDKVVVQLDSARFRYTV